MISYLNLPKCSCSFKFIPGCSEPGIIPAWQCIILISVAKLRCIDEAFGIQTKLVQCILVILKTFPDLILQFLIGID